MLSREGHIRSEVATLQGKPVTTNPKQAYVFLAGLDDVTPGSARLGCWPGNPMSGKGIFWTKFGLSSLDCSTRARLA